MDILFSLLEQYYDEMVAIRRYLHQHPELSHEEVETPKYIAQYHRSLGHEVREGVGGRGVVAKLVGMKPGKTVALRADFDALAIQEQNDVPYKSKIDGRMHACGHDGHTATLLVLAKALNQMKDELEGTIVFIHQFGEELAPGGAIAMIEDGCLDGVDVIFGTHLWTPEPVGQVAIRSGEFMAAADGFYITINGKGGHGAKPQETKDSIVIGSQFVMAAQQLLGRRVNPVHSAVVSICHFEALNPFNVIADSVKIKGTVRTFNEETRDQIEAELEEVLKASCHLYKATYDYNFVRGYDPVINDEALTNFFLEQVKETPQVDHIVISDPEMGGEDYGYYLQKVPGIFFFTGANTPGEENFPHHHPKFRINEHALLVAANTLGKLTLSYLDTYN
ncbi:amidohydrolase [Solibacillus sp. FSL R7-0668]|uniref:amidohydrolase n=1 Tax=Solibacillus sp. FSL R7-0668 TaxID=2921688 RepID=UPI0030FADF58